jgi:hypothetical protein
MMIASGAERAMARVGQEARLQAGCPPTERTMKSIWIGGRQQVEVPCNIEIEQTRDTLHAHVSLDGIEVEYGDEVLVHDAPSHIEFGERSVTSSRATVWRASALTRALVRMTSYLQLTELYEVGFQPKHEIKFKPVNPVTSGEK